MKQESDASKQPGQQPPGYEQQNPEQRNQPYTPGQQQGQTGTGGTQHYPPGEPQTPPTTYGECEEERLPEKPEEPCKELPAPPDLCKDVCYGPPEWGDDPCEDLCKEPNGREPWWKYPCRGLLDLKDCKDPDPCSGKKGKVPCEPCKGLIDEPADDNGKKCFEPCYTVGLPKDCDATGLQATLDELKKCISAQESQKAALNEAIVEAGKQQQELEKLVTGFTDILDKYDKARPALLSREDVLRGFFQKTKEALERELKPDIREALTNAINCEYCKLRKVECCKQTLEESLTCKVPLLRDKEQADAEAKRAGEAFTEIKDLAGAIIDKRFKDLETIQKTITEAWQSKKYRLMFYLFYWDFVPKFCDKFEPEICCQENKGSGEQQQSSGETKENQNQKNKGNGEQRQQSNGGGKETGSPPACIGSSPGDWHPSQIDREKLQKLLCCAFTLWNDEKAEAQQLSAEVKKKEDQLKFITEKLKQEKEKRDKTIRDKLDTVEKGYECVPKTPEGETEQAR